MNTTPTTDLNVPTNVPVENSCIPPKKFGRNEYGLICDGTVTYVYKPDGTIDWRKMIKPEFLVPHKQYFERKGLPIPDTTDGLEDSQILILLGGIKSLAQTRGYSCVNYRVTAPSRDYVASVCEIVWIPNFETHNSSIVFSAIGDAHDGNTNGLGKNFLGAIAENRSFCRAVRNFLQVHIVAQDEIGGSLGETPTTENAAMSLLRETMAKFGVTFSAIKERLIKDKVEGAEAFTSVEDIPRFLQFDLVARIKLRAAERAAADEAAKREATA